MISSAQRLDLHIKRAGGKNTYEAVLKDHAGNVLVTHTFTHRFDHYILSRLEDRRTLNFKEAAEQVRVFGRSLYDAVFGGEIAGYFISLRRQKQDVRLRLVFSPDDGDLLRVPWEFMYDGDTFPAASERVTLSRALEGVSTGELPPIAGRLRMLAVVSSPIDLKDHERLNSEQEQMLIMEAVDRANAANQIEIEFLDEASLKNIGDKLDEEEFHILHYTGHGEYSDKDDKGYLILEDDSGNSRRVDNEMVADLLAGHKSLRLVVLSGCQTAKTSGRRALSGMATPLLTRDIPAVVAMQYSVSDQSATALARKLYVEIGNGAAIDLALSRARRELLVERQLGEVEFATPVLYVCDTDCLRTDRAAASAKQEMDIKITLNVRVVLGVERLGKQFIGRRRELRRIKDGYLQRGIRVVVLHGIGGVGKTVTAAKVAENLENNFNGIYTFDCREALSAEKIIMQLHEFFKRFNINVLEDVMQSPVPIEAKIEFLAQALSKIKLLLIFDNFESLLSEEKGKWEIDNPDLKKALKTLVTQCHDGTRFLFTSRYTFNLTDDRLTNLIDEINLGEMPRPEAIMIMNRFADIARENFAVKNEIYDKIGGHPYTINFFGRHAAQSSVRQVLADLSSVRRDMIDFTLLDRSYKQLSRRAKKLIDAAAVFRKAIPLAGLKWLMDKAGEGPDISKELDELIHWGLIVRLHDNGDAGYQVHTLVRDFVKSQVPGDEWKKALVTAARCYEYLAKESHNIWGMLEARNLYFEAGEYDLAGGIVANVLMVPLHRWGLMELLKTLNQETVETADGRPKAAALHNLGMIHQDQGDHASAVEKYTESLGISEELGDEYGIAYTLGQLGNIHKNRGEYDKAVELYTRVMQISRELNDRSSIAITMHQLGMIHEDKGDYAAAVEKYTESLKIEEELGNKSGIARTLHQLGNIHYLQGDYAAAMEKYTESLRIKEELGHRSGIATTLHQLGMIHHAQGDHAAAIEKYTASLKIAEELGDKSGMAISLAQLGVIHSDQKKYGEALRNFLIAYSIFSELKSPRKEIALGLIAALQKKIGKKKFEKLYNQVMAESKDEEGGKDRKA